MLDRKEESLKIMDKYDDDKGGDDLYFFIVVTSFELTMLRIINLLEQL